MENFKKNSKGNLFVCLTLKRHKIRKNGARKFRLEANCRKFSPLSFCQSDFFFIVNAFLVMTSQRWVGHFIHLGGWWGCGRRFPLHLGVALVFITFYFSFIRPYRTEILKIYESILAFISMFVVNIVLPLFCRSS